MDTSKLVPNDPRVKEVTAQIRGKTYSYILGEPSNGQSPIDTVFLIHGFPDMAFGWRNQIPYLMSLGFRVVVPNMPGYAGTDAPQDLKEYSTKSVSADIKALATQFVGEKGQIILGGHDWGGMVVWRVVLWYPELIKAIFSVCTPFVPPNKTWFALEDHIAAGRVKNFTYQLQLAGPDVENAIQTDKDVRQFLSGMYGATGPNHEMPFLVEDGFQLQNLHILREPPLLSKDELQHYTKEYMKHSTSPLRGPLNWYRTRKINYDEELELAEKENEVMVEAPALFVGASNDHALPPIMSFGMEKFFKSLDREEVEASHWALTQAGPDVNKAIGKWLNKVLNGKLKSAL